MGEEGGRANTATAWGENETPQALWEKFTTQLLIVPCSPVSRVIAATEGNCSLHSSLIV